MNADLKKKSLGQFFTKNNFWMQQHIIEFIKSVKADIIFDPFAGNGDLLSCWNEFWIKEVFWLDIDENLGWNKNDSLINIPKIEKSITITNPPYLTNYSAKRKWIYYKVEQYFDSCKYDDIYQLAIEKCMINDYGVMIIPETFINSRFNKSRIYSITIIEDMLFNDTEVPVCVICFDNKEKSEHNIQMYKNDEYIWTFWQYNDLRKKPLKNVKINFNVRNGKIALRAVDSVKLESSISFMNPNELDYDLDKIQQSSRLITLIDFHNVSEKKISEIIKISNEILYEYRKMTKDVVLSPFKWNRINWERRRRLDYKTARAILEEAYFMT